MDHFLVKVVKVVSEVDLTTGIILVGEKGSSESVKSLNSVERHLKHRRQACDVMVDFGWTRSGVECGSRR